MRSTPTVVIPSSRKVRSTSSKRQAPRPATIQVLLGSVSLRTADSDLELREQHWAMIPPASHDLRALTDAAVLLTVVMAATRDAD